MKRIPSGLPSLDPIIGGGFPAGSFVLLTGVPGGGQREFALTSAIMTATRKGGGASSMAENVVLPERICYVSLGRSKKDVEAEINNSFSQELGDVFKEKVIYKDFSDLYYKSLQSYVSSIGANGRGGKKILRSLVAQFFRFLEEKAKNSVVIVHSITDMARFFEDQPHEFTLFLLKLQRSAKEWDGLVYGILSSGVFPERMEEEAVVVADGVIAFEWESSGEERERTMYFKKFRGLLPHIEERIGKFRVNITTSTGFVVSKIRVIKALR